MCTRRVLGVTAAFTASKLVVSTNFTVIPHRDATLVSNRYMPKTNKQTIVNKLKRNKINKINKIKIQVKRGYLRKDHLQPIFLLLLAQGE